MYHTEPPTDKTIREWYMNSSRVAACALRNEQAPSTKKKTWRDSLPIDMLLYAVSVLVVAQSSSEIPEGLMNNPVVSPSDIFLSSVTPSVYCTSAYNVTSLYPRCFTLILFGDFKQHEYPV